MIVIILHSSLDDLLLRIRFTPNSTTASANENALFLTFNIRERISEVEWLFFFKMFKAYLCSSIFKILLMNLII